MEEFRVDMRLTTPKEQAKYMQQGALLHRFNNCMPYSAAKRCSETTSVKAVWFNRLLRVCASTW